MQLHFRNDISYRKYREFSHGCIRVFLKLTEWSFGNDSLKNVDRFYLVLTSNFTPVNRSFKNDFGILLDLVGSNATDKWPN